MEKLFRCEGLTKKIGEYMLDDISFEIEPGMILGIIGINGSGKTTLIRTLTGSYRLDQSPEDKGEMWIGDKHFRKDQKEYRKSIAFIMQDIPFSKNLYSKQVGELYGPYYDGYDQEKYFRLLDEYKVPEKNFISDMSAGQQIRLQLAFAMSHDAELYILDEPVGNIDPDFRDSFYGLLREITADEAKSVILSSHLVTELENIADSLLWIGQKEKKGYVRFLGTIDDLRESYRIVEAEPELVEKLPSDMIVGSSVRESHKEVMIYLPDGKDFRTRLGEELYSACRHADLQEIMYYVEKNRKETP